MGSDSVKCILITFVGKEYLIIFFFYRHITMQSFPSIHICLSVSILISFRNRALIGCTYTIQPSDRYNLSLSIFYCFDYSPFCSKQLNTESPGRKLGDRSHTMDFLKLLIREIQDNAAPCINLNVTAFLFIVIIRLL